MNSKCGILIHCLAGVSRSATITIAYLMSRRSIVFDKAYAQVEAKKKNISPNMDFLMQLRDYETHVRTELSKTNDVVGVGNDSTINSPASVNSPASLDSPASYSNNSGSSLSPSPFSTTTVSTEDVDSAVDSAGSNAVFFNSSTATAFSSTSSTCTTPSPLSTTPLSTTDRHHSDSTDLNR